MQLDLKIVDEGPAEPLPIVEEMRLALCQIFDSRTTGHDVERGLLHLIDAFLPRPYKRTCGVYVELDDQGDALVQPNVMVRVPDVDCFIFLEEPAIEEDRQLRDSLNNLVNARIRFSSPYLRLTIYVKDGYISREEEPAVAFASKPARSILLTEALYYMDRGRLHRDDGPAVVRREKGIADIERVEYHLNGRRLEG